ncbi:hypothetical protein ACQ86O_01535 [Serratia sp. L9]
MKIGLWLVALMLAFPVQAIYLSSGVFTLESDRSFFHASLLTTPKTPICT